jgi:hypothetical protein
VSRLKFQSRIRDSKNAIFWVGWFIIDGNWD